MPSVGQERRRGIVRLPIVVAVAACLTMIVVPVSAPRTAAQARFAALPLESPAPAGNPATPERVALGRLLFWDPILSGQKDVACATCHHPDFGYSDGLDLSIGANGAGLGAARDVRSRPAGAAGQAQQPDGAERRVQRPHGWRGRGAGRRTDVLGSQGAQPRGAGAGADQGARGDARRRVSRAPCRAGRRLATERRSPEYRGCSLAPSAATGR